MFQSVKSFRFDHLLVFGYIRKGKFTSLSFQQWELCRFLRLFFAKSVWVVTNLADANLCKLKDWNLRSFELEFRLVPILNINDFCFALMPMLWKPFGINARLLIFWFKLFVASALQHLKQTSLGAVSHKRPTHWSQKPFKR